MSTVHTHLLQRLGLALAVGLGAVAVWLVGGGERAPTPPAETAYTLRWRAGHAQRYRVAVDSEVQIEVPGSSGAESLRQELAGELDFHTLEVGREHVTVGLRLSPVEYRIGGASSAATDEALALPFRVAFQDDGLPAAFEFSERVDLQARALLEELVRTFQLRIQQGSEWEAEERHATGTYAARYLRTDSSRLEKTKRHYLQASGASLSAGETRVLASSASIRLEPDMDWLGAMTVDERLASSQPSGVAVEVTTHAELHPLPASSTTVDAAPGPWAFAAADPILADVSHEAAARRTLPRTERDRAELRRRLAECLAALDLATDGRMLLVHELRDLLLADEELAYTLLEAMQARPFEDRTRADLFLVFELAGTPAAQTALCRVAAEPSWAMRDTLRALVALGGVENPTDESLRALWTITAQRDVASRDLANTAALALGAIGGQMRGQQGERYAALRDDLERTAWQAADAGERAIALLALGNTGDPSLAPVVVPFFDDGSPGVRKAAAHAVRKLGTDEVGDELLRRLRVEPSSSVRTSMAAALSAWDSPSTEAMETIRTLLPGEVDETARLNLVTFLGRNVEQFPENTRALEDLLESEGSTAVRKKIAETLAEAKLRARGGSGG